jgi:hypothetical protein
MMDMTNRQSNTISLCHNDIGSEYHYIFECSFPNVVDIRKKHIPSYYTKYPNFQKMIGLLSLCNDCPNKAFLSFIILSDTIHV